MNKKSLIAVGLLFLAVGTGLNAQNSTKNSRGNFSFGAKAGLNYSNVWDEEGQEFRADSKVGFAGGLFLGIPIGKLLGFQPEILLSNKGFQGSGTLVGLPYSFSRNTTYIDVPLQLQIKPSKFLTILAGPQYSYLIRQKSVYTFAENSVEQEQAFENENIRKNILGFTMGADVNVSHLVLSGKVGCDFLKNRGDGTSFTPRYKNQWLQLAVGYKF